MELAIDIIKVITYVIAIVAITMCYISERRNKESIAKKAMYIALIALICNLSAVVLSSVLIVATK